jgi:hypothetical protein
MRTATYYSSHQCPEDKLMTHTYREDMAEKKKLGIIERLKQAKTLVEITKLTKEAESYEHIDSKTVRKFTKISKKKIAQIKKSKPKKNTREF